ncbi:hypothetical protein KC19_10G099300 [Ceratodon purpureus]|uniref:Uncharacterized protein n=1 Tax=Ceratodon purpureus TaxID=3225 RepID=A0A8T0GLD1_CERPU|nr:hypothetical protein KC19_10G099300 [Ceratodon purpureus]
MVALGGKTTEIWDKRLDHWNCRARWRRGSRRPQTHVPWPTLCDDRRVLRVLDPIADTEAERILKKKYYEEERRNSNGLNIPRCPSKGYAGRHMSRVQRRCTTSSKSSSPILFTIPNFLTPGDCERLIAASNQQLSYHHSHLDPEGASAAFCCIYSSIVNMWTSGLKAVFAGIRIKEERNAFAVGIGPYVNFMKYENSGGYELRPFDPQNYKRVSQASPKFYTFYGYSVLVYLNGSRDDVDSHTGSSRDVVGGETHAFYSRQHGGKSKQHIAKIAPKTGMAVCIARGDREPSPKTGMAVCIARGDREPSIEVTPVADGVMYMIDFDVDFSNFTNEEFVRCMSEQKKNGKQKPRST